MHCQYHLCLHWQPHGSGSATRGPRSYAEAWSVKQRAARRRREAQASWATWRAPAKRPSRPTGHHEGSQGPLQTRRAMRQRVIVAAARRTTSPRPAARRQRGPRPRATSTGLAKACDWSLAEQGLAGTEAPPLQWASIARCQACGRRPPRSLRAEQHLHRPPQLHARSRRTARYPDRLQYARAHVCCILPSWQRRSAAPPQSSPPPVAGR
mmetsp:Transcript_64919/g.189930  ORF Transcript_64919/g.189930 Transcript_64919/m.189930 type:complete len:210 (-) Transcript_64919:156-785(-)